MSMKKLMIANKISSNQGVLDRDGLPFINEMRRKSIPKLVENQLHC